IVARPNWRTRPSLKAGTREERRQSRIEYPSERRRDASPEISMNEPKSARAPGWPVWGPIAAMFFVNGAIYGVWATQIPLAKLRLGLDPSALGGALFMVGLGAIAAMAASGWMLHRIGAAALVRISGVVFCILLPLACIAASAPELA